MKIDASDATNHIINSMDNDNSNFWYDSDNEVTWYVHFGPNGTIRFTFISETGEEDTEQAFKLVEVLTDTDSSGTV